MRIFNLPEVRAYGPTLVTVTHPFRLVVQTLVIQKQSSCTLVLAFMCLLTWNWLGGPTPPGIHRPTDTWRLGRDIQQCVGAWRRSSDCHFRRFMYKYIWCKSTTLPLRNEAMRKRSRAREERKSRETLIWAHSRDSIYPLGLIDPSLNSSRSPPHEPKRRAAVAKIDLQLLINSVLVKISDCIEQHWKQQMMGCVYTR